MRTLPPFLGLLLLGAIIGPSWAQTSYPLTIDNCGMQVTLPAAPQRMVAIKSSAVELLLALGVAERIVGVGFQDGPVPEQWADAAKDLAVLSDKLPSQEVVLATEPDFVYGGWESNFTGEGAGERAVLQQLGVASYVSPAACRSIKPPKLTFDALFDEMAELGRLVDATAQAEALIARQRAELAKVTADNRGLTAVWYSSGTKIPYVGAGSNAPAMMLEALGLNNIMGSVDDGWISASWEAVVAADPDVIVLVDAVWNSAEQKKKLLAENPITSQLDAVQQQHYLVIPFPASEAGVRNVGAVTDMATQLAKLSFGP